MSYDFAREIDEAMLASDPDSYGCGEETRCRPRYACTDRMCGALDCQTCHPGNHDEEAE